MCELRLLVELSQEPKWIKALKTGKDLHMMVYADLHNVKYEDVVGENGKPLEKYLAERVKIKALNFGLIYGMGPKKLAEDTGTSFSEAKETMATFFRTYPKIKKYLNKLESDAQKNSYALSPLDNRRRYLIDFDWDIFRERSHACNIAKNMAFQSSNASITKYALVLIRNEILNRGWDKNNKAMIICAIHDELLVEVHDSIAEEMFKIQEKEMLNAAYHFVKTIPMAVESTLANFWVK